MILKYPAKEPETPEEFLKSFEENRHTLTQCAVEIVGSVVPEIPTETFKKKFLAGVDEHANGEWSFTSLWPTKDLKEELTDTLIYLWWLYLLMHFHGGYKSPDAGDVSSMLKSEE